MSIFDYLWVRNLTMWTASGIASTCYLLLSVDSFSSGPYLFNGVVFSAMALSIFLPSIALGLFVYDFLDVLISTVVGYVMGVLGLALFVWFEKGGEFLGIFYASMWLSISSALLIMPLIFVMSFLGYFAHRLYWRIVQKWVRP